ncbi:MAG: Vps62-related protein [Chitinispirillaceae bacterium]|nr:Vps62-related protein [Chitinispirillaceae bacterium]
MRKTCKIALCLFLVSAWTIMAANEIKITGTVTDSATALNKAIILLKGESMSTYTDSEGAFTLTNMDPTDINAPVQQITGFSRMSMSYANKSVHITLGNASSKLVLEAYSILGRLVARKDLGMAPFGTHSYTLEYLWGKSPASGHYILCARRGDERCVIRVIVMDWPYATIKGNGKISHAIMTPTQKASTAAFDTLIITKLGYFPKRVPLITPITSMKIQLEKASITCIDVGGLQIGFVNTYTKVWTDEGSGGSNDGSYWNPVVDTSDGFFPVGSYGRAGYIATPTKEEWMVVVRDGNGMGILKHPTDYQQVWTDAGSGANADGSFWRPVPPTGYVALGLVANSPYTKPSVNQVMCVKEEFTIPAAPSSTMVWTDAGTGADRDFGSWRIVPKAGSFISKSPLPTGAFCGWQSHSAPTSVDQCPEMNVLCVALPLVYNNDNVETVPELGPGEPEATTVPHLGKIMYVPFPLISDGSSFNASWQIANSPFYAVERQQFYTRLFYDVNSTSSAQSILETITTGVSKEKSDEFSVKTGISVTSEAGFSLKGFSASVSVTVSIEFGYTTSTSITMYQERSVEKSLIIPPQTAAVLWQKSDQVISSRLTGTGIWEPVAGWVIPLDSYVHDEYSLQ